ARGRRRDARELEVELAGSDRRFGDVERRFALIIFLAGDGLLLDQDFSAFECTAGELGVGLGGSQRRLRGARVEREKQLATGDALAFSEVRRLDKAAGARTDLDALGGLEATGELVPVGHVLQDRKSVV